MSQFPVHCFYDSLNAEYDRELREAKEYLDRKTRRYPGTDLAKEWTMGLGFFGGLIFGIAFWVSYGFPYFFLGVALGVALPAALCFGIYGLFCLPVLINNRSREKHYQAEVARLEEEKAARTEKFQRDFSRRYQEIKGLYEQSSKSSPIYDWLIGCWEQTILSAPQDAHLPELSPSFCFTVQPDRIIAYSRSTTGDDFQLMEEFNCKKMRVEPITQSTDEYRRMVEISAYAKLLHRICRAAILGDDKAPGKYAYPPNTIVKDESTKARFELDPGDYPSPGNCYKVTYRAKNPNYVPERSIF